MDKQFYVLLDHKEKDITWKKGEVILLDPEFALPYIGSHITPLYSAIKAGLYKTDEPRKPLIAKIVAEVKESFAKEKEPVAKVVAPDSNDVITEKPTQKKLLQNKLQAQIIAKKQELARTKNNS